ncbi:cytochrome P450 [Schizopora paradoxa]|uniref:Cytochrome P450 n=1 Tax=Schizopora paradoxa TaxID=27342 RepID=A0A0H2R652_9AGAM|nr:cytochrome P450 [Schizopora paradoxa]
MEFNTPFANIYVYVASLTCTALIYRWLTNRKERALPHPPGPKGLPFIGNLLQMPSSRIWEKASQWGEEFGDIVYVENLGKPMLFLNSYDDAVELLANRSALYSSRPHSTMSMDLEGWDWMMINIPYGDTLRKHRAYHHRFISNPDILNYLDVQASETRKMLCHMLDAPEEYEKHIARLPGAISMLNVYGHRVEKNDRYIELGMTSIRYASEAAGERYFFLDLLPWLKHIPECIPFVDFPRVAKAARKVSHAVLFDLYELTKKRVAEGNAMESMTTIFLSENTKDDGIVEDEEDFCAAAATFFTGGVDTTVTAIMSFVLAMLKNPEAQRLAQLEIDRVVGNDRLPTFEDKENLPYVQALCEEVLRFATITPFTLPHLTTADDVYKGYSIPAGTVVFANIWELCKNPEFHDDPAAFRPERWLSLWNEDTKGEDANGRRPRNYAFGFGRRICTGQKWAEHLLFIAAASMLAAFNIEKAVDEDGKPIAPNEDYLQSFVRTLGPSRCKITPRSLKMASLVRLSVEDD